MSSPETPAPPVAEAPAVQPQIIIIEKKGNGLGIAGFVCGILSAIFGLIPLLFFITFPLAVLGMVFGAIGWARARSDAQRGGKGLSIAGLILGLIGFALGVWGLVIIDDAFS